MPFENRNSSGKYETKNIVRRKNANGTKIEFRPKRNGTLVDKLALVFLLTCSSKGTDGTLSWEKRKLHTLAGMDAIDTSGKLIYFFRRDYALLARSHSRARHLGTMERRAFTLTHGKKFQEKMYSKVWMNYPSSTVTRAETLQQASWSRWEIRLTPDSAEGTPNFREPWDTSFLAVSTPTQA